MLLKRKEFGFPSGNPSGYPCQPLESTVPPSSFPFNISGLTNTSNGRERRKNLKDKQTEKGSNRPILVARQLVLVPVATHWANRGLLNVGGSTPAPTHSNRPMRGLPALGHTDWLTNQRAPNLPPSHQLSDPHSVASVPMT